MQFCPRSAAAADRDKLVSATEELHTCHAFVNIVTRRRLSIIQRHLFNIYVLMNRWSCYHNESASDRDNNKQQQQTAQTAELSRVHDTDPVVIWSVGWPTHLFVFGSLS